MSHEAVMDYKKHVRTYLSVFVALAFLTLVTVLIASYHFAPALAVTIALLIATLKGSLVACYFMHLISEKKLILAIFVSTLFLGLCMVFIILLAVQGRVSG